MKKFSLFLVCVFCLSCLSTGVSAQLSKHQYPMDVGMESKSEKVTVGNNTFIFSITPLWVEDSYRLEIKGIGGLTILGETTYDFEGKFEKQEEFTIEVDIPNNDTCAIDIEIYLGDEHTDFGGYDRWFVTTGDTVEVYNAKPVKWTEPRKNWPSLEDFAASQEEKRKRREQIKSGQAIIGEHYKETKFVPTEREKMAFREQKPCLNHTGEFITVDGIQYRRNYGEYKFHECEIIPDPEARLDSLTQYRKDNADKLTKHIVMDLKDPEDYDFVARLCPELKTMEREGYYEGVLTLRQIEMIIDRGIQSQPYPRYPGDLSRRQAERMKKQNQENTEKKTESESDKADKDENYLFEYYFEEPIDTDIWHIGDYNPNDGDDYWGRVDTTVGRVADGNGSAWCAGNGDQTPCIYYDLNMNSYMYLAEPIDVSNSGSYEICYSYYLESEDNYDFLWVLLYRNGIGWVCLDSLSGFYDGLISGADYLYDNSDFSTQDISLRFMFFSDDSYCYLEGAYIDGIEVWGEKPRPDLRPCGNIGWSCPIIVSSGTGSHTDTDIYDNQPSYIDISVVNDGDWDGVAGPFSIALFIDDNPQPIAIRSWNDSLEYGDYASFDDIEHEFEPGIHQLRMEVDYYNTVDEIYEDDNSYTRTITCEDNFVNMYGDLHYRDLKTGTFHNARNIFIEIWDANYPSSDVLIDTMWADMNGHFGKSSIRNEDTDGQGGTLDVYLKFFARNEAAYSHDERHPPDSCLHELSDLYEDTPCCDLTITTSASSLPEAGAFFIIDQIKEARDSWSLIRPMSNLSPVGIYFCNYGTGFDRYNNVILVDTSNSISKLTPDTFDRDILIEEYGHKIECDIGFFNAAVGDTHTWFSRKDAEFATSEAFSYFWTCLVRNDSMKVNCFKNFQDSSMANLENGKFYYSGSSLGCVVDSGQLHSSSDLVEGNVACILWDLYDQTIDDQNGDGYGDRVRVSATQMFDVLCSDTADAVFEFIDDWFNSGYGSNHGVWEACREQMNNVDNSPPTGTVTINNGSTETMSLLVDLQLNVYDSISGVSSMRFGNDSSWYTFWVPFNSQIVNWDLSDFGGDTAIGQKTVYIQVADSSNECNLWGPVPFSTSAIIQYSSPTCGDVNADSTVNIGDAIYLINYIFKGGPPPSPLEAGNVNCDSTVNLGDGVYVIAYIFKQGPSPCDCPKNSARHVTSH